MKVSTGFKRRVAKVSNARASRATEAQPRVEFDAPEAKAPVQVEPAQPVEAPVTNGDSLQLYLREICQVKLLTPAEVPRLWLAVVKPAESIATAALFASPRLVRDSEAAILASFAAIDRLVASTLVGFGKNDLQAAAEAECAQVVEAATLVHRRFGNSRMTGSGSAVFARAGTGHEPQAAMPGELEPGWTGRMCRSLSEHPLMGWSADC